MGDPQTIIIQAAALVLAITFHEAAHGWVAYRNGDPTAHLAGRITLNPIPHVDLFGTIIFPGLLLLMQAPILIGWAKPVPVNPRNFRNPRKGFALVSVAGPGSNLLLAGLCAITLKIWTTVDPELIAYLTDGGGHGVKVALPIFLFLWMSVKLNVILGVFNLFPIPPLDGGHFLMGVLPPKQSLALAQVERFGMLIVLLLVYLGVLDLFVRPISQFFVRLFLL
jgi:Zn-dependent protease